MRSIMPASTSRSGYIIQASGEKYHGALTLKLNEPSPAVSPVPLL